MRAEDVGVVGVEDVGLDRLAEQGLGVVDQVGVQRVVARDHHAERVAGAAPGPTDLLPERGAGAREAGEEHGVEAADVDAELEGVRGGQAEQPAVAQGRLELAALLGEVAAAVRRDLVDQARVDLAEQPSRGERHRLGAAPGPDERERAHPFDDQVGQQVGDLAGRGAAYGRAVLAQPGHERRLPQGQRGASTWRAVLGDRHDVEAGEPPGRHLRLGDGGRGQHEGGVGAVQRRHPPQPPQDLGDVGAEDAAVVVALVDDDVAQGAEEPRPARVAGQQGAVQHVGVGQDVLAVVARPLPHLGGGVAVVGGGPQVGQPGLAEPAERRELVLGERLGRREVEDTGAALALRAAGGLDRVQPGQQVGQRLARGRSCGDHGVPALVGEVGGGDLVRPRSRYAEPLERLADGVVQPRRPRVHTRRTGLDDLEVGQAVSAPGTARQPPHERFEIHHLHPFSLSADPDGLPTSPPVAWFNTFQIKVEA